jgi:hypothetical protein
MTGPLAVIIAGFLLAGLGLFVLWRAHRSKANKIDLAHLIVDRDGHTSLRQSSECVALLVTSWIVLWLAVSGTLTEGIFGVYVVAWVLRTLAGPTMQAWASSLQSKVHQEAAK